MEQKELEKIFGYFYIVDFSYNGNLGVLQQKTKDNLLELARLNKLGVLSNEKFEELEEKTRNYFTQEIKKVLASPNYYIL